MGLRWMPGVPCSGKIYYQQATHNSVTYTICKTSHSGALLYTLTRGKSETIARADNSADLKRKAEELSCQG